MTSCSNLESGSNNHIITPKNEQLGLFPFFFPVSPRVLVSKKRLVLRALKEIKESTESLELKQLVRVTMPYLTRIEERVSVEELE